MNEPTLDYDEGQRVGTISFPGGHKLKVRNVDREQAQTFFKKHSAEFARRDCVLQTSACIEVRNV
jgi:hypothetical protein